MSQVSTVSPRRQRQGGGTRRSRTTPSASAAHTQAVVTATESPSANRQHQQHFEPKPPPRRPSHSPSRKDSANSESQLPVQQYHPQPPAAEEEEETHKMANGALVGGTSLGVTVRVRSFCPEEQRQLAVRMRGNTCQVSIPDQGVFVYSFDRCFWSNDVPDSEIPFATQADVFEGLAKPLLDSCLQGYNASILAYGPTGSGKTYTMFGNPVSAEESGIIPRFCNELFLDIEEDPDSTSVNVSVVEVYLEEVYDLLEGRKKCVVCGDGKRGFIMKNQSVRPVSTYKDVQQILSEAETLKTTASTAMNERSSRAHTLFEMHINRAGACCNVLLVDLAGSERANDAKTTGLTFEQAKSINMSLLNLGHCIQAIVKLARKSSSGVANADDVPQFRESTITKLLKNSLGGNSKTSLVVTIPPGLKQASRTLQALRFGDRAKHIKTHATINTVLADEVIVRNTIDALGHSARIAAQGRLYLYRQVAHVQQLQWRLAVRSITKREFSARAVIVVGEHMEWFKVTREMLRLKRFRLMMPTYKQTNFVSPMRRSNSKEKLLHLPRIFPRGRSTQPRSLEKVRSRLPSLPPVSEPFKRKQLPAMAMPKSLMKSGGKDDIDNWLNLHTQKMLPAPDESPGLPPPLPHRRYTLEEEMLNLSDDGPPPLLGDSGDYEGDEDVDKKEEGGNDNVEEQPESLEEVGPSLGGDSASFAMTPSMVYDMSTDIFVIEQQERAMLQAQQINAWWTLCDKMMDMLRELQDGNRERRPKLAVFVDAGYDGENDEEMVKSPRIRRRKVSFVDELPVGEPKKSTPEESPTEQTEQQQEAELEEPVVMTDELRDALEVLSGEESMDRIALKRMESNKFDRITQNHDAELEKLLMAAKPIVQQRKPLFIPGKEPSTDKAWEAVLKRLESQELADRSGVDISEQRQRVFLRRRFSNERREIREKEEEQTAGEVGEEEEEEEEEEFDVVDDSLLSEKQAATAAAAAASALDEKQISQLEDEEDTEREEIAQKETAERDAIRVQFFAERYNVVDVLNSTKGSQNTRSFETAEEEKEEQEAMEDEEEEARKQEEQMREREDLEGEEMGERDDIGHEEEDARDMIQMEFIADHETSLSFSPRAAQNVHYLQPSPPPGDPPPRAMRSPSSLMIADQPDSKEDLMEMHMAAVAQLFKDSLQALLSQQHPQDDEQQEKEWEEDPIPQLAVLPPLEEVEEAFDDLLAEHFQEAEKLFEDNAPPLPPPLPRTRTASPRPQPRMITLRADFGPHEDLVAEHFYKCQELYNKSVALIPQEDTVITLEADFNEHSKLVKEHFNECQALFKQSKELVRPKPRIITFEADFSPHAKLVNDHFYRCQDLFEASAELLLSSDSPEPELLDFDADFTQHSKLVEEHFDECQALFNNSAALVIEQPRSFTLEANFRPHAALVKEHFYKCQDLFDESAALVTSPPVEAQIITLEADFTEHSKLVKEHFDQCKTLFGGSVAVMRLLAMVDRHFLKCQELFDDSAELVTSSRPHMLTLEADFHIHAQLVEEHFYQCQDLYNECAGLIEEQRPQFITLEADFHEHAKFVEDHFTECRKLFNEACFSLEQQQRPLEAIFSEHAAIVEEHLEAVEELFNSATENISEHGTPTTPSMQEDNYPYQLLKEHYRQTKNLFEMCKKLLFTVPIFERIVADHHDAVKREFDEAHQMSPTTRKKRRLVSFSQPAPPPDIDLLIEEHRDAVESMFFEAIRWMEKPHAPTLQADFMPHAELVAAHKSQAEALFHEAAAQFTIAPAAPVMGESVLREIEHIADEHFAEVQGLFKMSLVALESLMRTCSELGESQVGEDKILPDSTIFMREHWQEAERLFTESVEKVMLNVIDFRPMELLIAQHNDEVEALFEECKDALLAERKRLRNLVNFQVDLRPCSVVVEQHHEALQKLFRDSVFLVNQAHMKQMMAKVAAQHQTR